MGPGCYEGTTKQFYQRPNTTSFSSQTGHVSPGVITCHPGPGKYNVIDNDCDIIFLTLLQIDRYLETNSIAHPLSPTTSSFKNSGRQSQLMLSNNCLYQTQQLDAVQSNLGPGMYSNQCQSFVSQITNICAYKPGNDLALSML